VRKYEFTYILDPNLDDAAAATSLEKYAKLIRDHGGEVTHREVWGRRKFSYEIHHKTEGTYVFLRMNTESKAVEELNRALHFDETVVRSLIVLDEEADVRNEEARRRARPRDAEAGGHAPQPAGQV
jgi:small subunit ribosomal protein S6